MIALYWKLRRAVIAALGQSSPLVLARLLSAALTFGLPLALVRLLEPEAFGTYKQFFLVAQTLLLVGQLGLTQSLYYFLPRGGTERGAYVTHALTSLATLGVLFGGALYLLAPAIGHWVGSGELSALKLPLALYAAAMLAAAPLEATLTSERRIGGAAISYVVTDGVRAAALFAAAKWGVHLIGAAVIFWAATGVALLRILALVVLVARGILPTARPHWALLRRQLAFALPFAGASWLYVGQRFFSQYAVSASFDAATFALFAVASFHLPVVDIVFTPITEVLMVQLGNTLGRDPRASMHHWDDAIDKLSAILLPAACGAWLLGPTVLPLLFTHKYQGAVPLFLLTTLEIPLWILPVDALLRAAGDTRFLFAFNAVRVVFTGACVIAGIKLGGLRGAIVGGLISEALARGVMLARGRRFLGGRLSELLDLPSLSRTGAAAALACAPAFAMRFVVAPGASMVVSSMAVYGIAYLGLRALLGKKARIAACPAPASA